MARFQINTDYLVKTLVEPGLKTPSPTGDSEWAVSFIEQELEGLGHLVHPHAQRVVGGHAGGT